ncbi:hypothetical protein AOLI_G00114500 [Acnodon oligacanthus]
MLPVILEMEVVAGVRAGVLGADNNLRKAFCPPPDPEPGPRIVPGFPTGRPGELGVGCRRERTFTSSPSGEDSMATSIHSIPGFGTTCWGLGRTAPHLLPLVDAETIGPIWCQFKVMRPETKFGESDDQDRVKAKYKYYRVQE